MRAGKEKPSRSLPHQKVAFVVFDYIANAYLLQKFLREKWLVEPECLVPKLRTPFFPPRKQLFLDEERLLLWTVSTWHPSTWPTAPAEQALSGRAGTHAELFPSSEPPKKIPGSFCFLSPRFSNSEVQSQKIDQRPKHCSHLTDGKHFCVFIYLAVFLLLVVQKKKISIV